MNSFTSYEPEDDLIVTNWTLSNNSIPCPIDRHKTYHYYGLPLVLMFTVLLIIIMVMALVGNFLVITTILRNKDMRTRTNILLCNLAVADILVALLDIPVAIVTLNYGCWPFSDAFCYFNGYLVGLGLMLSIHTLMWISIHKFISITRPLARSMTPGKIFCMIFAAWMWALLYNLGPLLGWTDTVYKAGASQCGPVIPKTAMQVSHSVTNTIFNFIIPICVMSYCYYKIFAEVQEHMNRLQDFSDTTIISSIVQQRRITKTLVIVFVCFTLCWCPYIIYSTLLVMLGKDNVRPIFNPLAYLATYLNSACNPIIYALRSPSFRKGFKEILLGSRNIANSPFGNKSFRWTRVNDGIMISFRRSLLRSKSESDGMSAKKKGLKTGYTKDSQTSSKSFLKEYKHRRRNTIPKDKQEREVKNVSTGEVLLSNLISEQTKRPVQRLSSGKSLSSQPTSITSPHIVINKESNLLSKDGMALQTDNVFFDTPTPKDKKYFLYFPKFQNHALSISAPNLLLNMSEDHDENSENSTEDDILLKIPEISYTRACSEGDVKPLYTPKSSLNSQSYQKIFPHLTWQASLESINVDKISNHKNDDMERCFQKKRNQNHSSSSQDLDRRSKIPNLLNSVECLINNFFAPDSAKWRNVRPYTETLSPEDITRVVNSNSSQK